MSIFASRTQKTIDLPFDPPHTVTIRRLAGRHLEKAEREHLVATIDHLKALGGVAFQRELESLGDETARNELIAKRQQDPLSSVDIYVVLRHGIVSWTYDEPVSVESIEDLDDEAATFLAREIMRLSRPSLFLSTEDAEREQKKAGAAAPVA